MLKTPRRKLRLSKRSFERLAQLLRRRRRALEYFFTRKK
jgi:hypothetical protein